MPKSKARILIVDDQNGHTALKSCLEASGGACVKVRHPNEVDEADLQNIDLLLVDYQLDDWPERDNLETPSLKPLDGLALAAIYRRKLQTSARPSAIAIHTGKLMELARPLPPDHREHALARLNNLEWVFEKASPGTASHLAAQLLALAAAVDALPSHWPITPQAEPLGPVLSLLGVRNGDPCKTQIVEDISNCLPPLHELSQWSHGLAVLRWFLHRILPYPSFLWDAHRLACRLRVDVNDLETALNAQTNFGRSLARCEYRGMLSNFLGPRWWRSQVESLLWKETKNHSADAGEVGNFLKKAAKNKLKPLPGTETLVVCVNKDYQPLKEFYPITEAVRIRPDDWPSYSDQAWTTPALALEHPTLNALVEKSDRHKLTETVG